MTVEMLLNSVSAEEMTEWMAVYHIDPWDNDRTDYGLGQICALLFNNNLSPEHRSRAKRPKDFMPWADIRRELAYDEEQASARLLSYLTGLSKRER